MTNTTLSNVHPDWEDIALQLTTSLSQKQGWQPLMPTQTAAMMLESMAAIGTFLSQGVQLSFEERFPQTAKLDSSFLAIARGLGVRLQRKNPAHTTVTLNRDVTTSAQSIPAYSVFISGGTKLFNRNTILFPSGVGSVDVTLYEGSLTRVRYTGTGATDQVIIVNVPGFTVSDADVRVNVSGTQLEVITDGVWHYSVTSGNNIVVQDSTLPTGELALEFGNTQFGYIPANGSNVYVTYAATNGSAGNDPNFLGEIVTYSDNNTIKGAATSALVDGDDQPSPSNYQDSPLAYASYNRAVALPDHPSIARQYPNIADAMFLGQKDIAPALKEFMNVVYVYLIRDDATQLDVPDYATFLTWFQRRAMPLEYVRQLATVINVGVSATIYITDQGDVETAKARATDAIQGLFVVERTYLGRNLYVDDIIKALRNCYQYIDHVTIESPTADVVSYVDQPQVPTLAALTGSGTLVAGNTYNYAVSAVAGAGETLISPSASITIPTGSTRARIRWVAVPGATAYRVYGRTSGDLFLLNQTTTLEYIDNGSVTTGTPVNQVRTTGIGYARLTGLSIAVDFTERRSV